MVSVGYEAAMTLLNRIRCLALLGLLSPAAAIAQADRSLETEALAKLPEPVSNNAVASLEIGGVWRMYSFMGLRAGKKWTDTTAARPSPPGTGANARWTGRIRIYVFGGYTVAADDSEESVPLVHVFEPRTRSYREISPMPVPVDDTVAVSYQDRYIYLISGWHDTDNVNLVQVLDTHEERWFQATPYPGAPVFGHAGGIIAQVIVVCDGVRIESNRSARRAFVMSPDCYRGQIDADDPARIDWFSMPHHPHRARYRMAAAASGDKILFAGGSDNPYNYNGIGYDGVPSAPGAEVFAYSLLTGYWERVGTLDQATMDHRGLARLGDSFVIIGGMRERQRVSASVFRFELP